MIMNSIINISLKYSHKRILPFVVTALLAIGCLNRLPGQDNTDLLPFRTGHLFGFVDKNLRNVISPTYDEVKPFKGDVAVVKIFRKYGLIDKTGKAITPFKYDEVENEGHSWIIVKQGRILNWQHGLINNKGQELMPLDFDYIIPVGNTVLIATKGDLCGLYDTLGKIIIPVEYLKMDYQDGLLPCKKNKLFGVFHENGQLIVPFEFDTLVICPDHFIAVFKNNKGGWYNKYGKEICKTGYDFLGYFNDGVSVFKRNGKYGLMDINGKEVLPPEFEGIWNFSNGCGLILKNNKYGFADQSGIIILPPEYDAAWPFVGGRARVYKDGKYAFIDSTGKFVTQFQFTVCKDYLYGMAKVGWDNKLGFIDMKGNILFSEECTYLSDFSESVALIQKGEKYGMINRKFKEVVPIRYDTLIISFKKFITAKSGDKKDIYNLDGKLLAGQKYTIKYPVNEYFIRVNIDEGKSLLNKNGQEVFPCKYSHISISTAYYGISPFHLDKKMGYIDTNGHIILKPEYDWCTSFKEGFGEAQIGIKSSFVNKQGKLLTPLKFINLNVTGDGLLQVKENFSSPVWDYIDTNGRELWAPYMPEKNKSGQKKSPVSLSNTERFIISSSFNGKKYCIHVALPKDYYQTNKKYPVLYLTDADYLLGIAKNSADLLTFPKLIPELIIVGLAYESTFEDWWSRRAADLTPAPDSTAYMFPGGGGAESFLKTLEKQIIPFIEQKYRIYDNERAYAGYSLGGLFGAYTLFHRPGLFNRYLLISPSFWWNKGMIFKAEEDFSASIKNIGSTIIFTAGSMEADMQKDIDKMMKELKDDGFNSILTEFIKTEGDNHYSTFPTAFTKGIQALYK